MVRKGARRPKVNVEKTNVFFFSNGCDLRRGVAQAGKSPAQEHPVPADLPGVVAEVPAIRMCPVSFL